MRDDVLVEFVRGKCEVLKRSRMWLSEPRMRPSAWLENFDDSDKRIAALLLDRFIFCNDETCNALLLSAWQSIADGLSKGPKAPASTELLNALRGQVVFTPVEGESPCPTDSGYLICRKARQVLGIPEDCIKSPSKALVDASRGATVVFLDDFVGSGDQFLESWWRDYNGTDSFCSVQSKNGFKSIYVTLVTTDYGLNNINKSAPGVAVCPAHIIEDKSNIRGLIANGVLEESEVFDFLSKYSTRLTPSEPFIASNPRYRMFGYRERGLFLGFEHSIPDATLPIFWSTGIDGWEPLIERV